VVNSTEDNFIQERALHLQQYLNKVATHPTLRQGNPLRIFLTHQDLGASVEWFNMTTRIIAPVPSSPETPQRPPLAITSPGQSRDIGRFFKELRQTVVQSTAVTAVGGVLGLETPKPKVMEEDAAFLVEKDKVLRYEQELSAMSQKATKMLTLQQKFGESIGEFGMECLKFARLQEEEGTRLGKYSENGMSCMTGANEMRKAGNTSIKASRLARTATSQTAQSLEPLHDYLKLLPAVRKSVADRNEALLTLQTMLAESDRLDARIAKLTPDLTKMRKVEELKFELERTQALGEQARTDYKEIQERHRGEFSRLEKERVAQFHEMMLSHARVQVANAERSLSLWRGLAEEFGASPAEWTSPKAEPVDEGELS
jgi:sorting nexin-1/2